MLVDREVRIASIGHAVFAAIVLAFGILGVLHADFGPIWEPVANDVPARSALVRVCSFVCVAAGIGLFWRRLAALAARVLLGYLLIWLLAFRARAIVRAPDELGSWDGCAEMAVIVAGAWVLYAWFARGFASGETGVRIARVLYGLALIPFGIAHLVYVDETAALVPDWLPAHVVWAYGTGGAFLVAGAAILVGVFARPAAALSALQIGLFTILVWIPVAVTGTPSAFQWHELGISAALAAGAWVVADSYRVTRATPLR